MGGVKVFFYLFFFERLLDWEGIEMYVVVKETSCFPCIVSGHRESIRY